MDNNNLMIGDFRVPLLKPGFRKVVFAIVIMLIVIFWQRGIMGESEFSIAGIKKAARKFIAGRKAKKGGAK